jgi:hypothetical protein
MIISQHLCIIFKSHKHFSIKRHSCHKHKCCPTSDESLPVKRISPINLRSGSGTRISLSRASLFSLVISPVRFTCVCPITRDVILRSMFCFVPQFAIHWKSSHSFAKHGPYTTQCVPMTSTVLVQTVETPIDSGIDLSIRIDNLRVLINKTLSTDSLINQHLIKRARFSISIDSR